MKNVMEVVVMKVLVGMDIQEFSRIMRDLGLQHWGGKGNREIFGKITYQDGDLQDWMEVVIRTDGEVLIDLASGEVIGSVVRYGTNRSVPGWSLCPATGEWLSESEYDERCDEEDSQPFVIPEKLLLHLRWKASHVADAY